MCYVFFRLHHLLTMRIAEAYRLASLMEANTSASSRDEDARDGMTKDSSLETMEIAESSQNGSPQGEKDTESGEEDTDVLPRAPVFSRYLTQLYAFLDGKIDSTRFLSPSIQLLVLSTDPWQL